MLILILLIVIYIETELVVALCFRIWQGKTLLWGWLLVIIAWWVFVILATFESLVNKAL